MTITRVKPRDFVKKFDGNGGRNSQFLEMTIAMEWGGGKYEGGKEG